MSEATAVRGSLLRDVFIGLPKLRTKCIRELLSDCWIEAHSEQRLELRAAESQGKAQSKRFSRDNRRQALPRARSR